MKQLTPVVQEDKTGCALATIATLSSQPYQDVKTRAAALGIHPEDKRIWSETTFVYQLAADQGFQLAPSPETFTDWEALPALAVMAIKWRLIDGIPFWHWVVFQRTEVGPVVLDPGRHLKQHRRTDFGRIKPAWYIEVTGIPG